jgi:threonine dehydratase
MITLRDIEKARTVVSEIVQQTPIVTSTGICACLPGEPADVLFKAENLQRTGSFKIRGAINRLSHLSDAEKASGVVAASAGNHAQGVALAAARIGVPATIFMPETASIAKVKATEGYGARVIMEGQTFDESQAAGRAHAEDNGGAFIAAFDDDGIIAGQGTLGLDILDDVPDVETVLIPIGGGGLFAGVAVALKETRPIIRVIGIQAAGANTAVRSYASGKLLDAPSHIDTICDGIAVKSPSARTFSYIHKYADDVIDVPDSAVSQAMLLLLERTKMIVEPSGAVGLAALLLGRVQPTGKTVVILTGGNIDVLRLSGLMEREMLRMDRYLHIGTACRDHPGALVEMLSIVAAERGNVITIRHNRLSRGVPLGKTGVEVLIEVRDREHGDGIVTAMEEAGYYVERLER